MKSNTLLLCILLLSTCEAPAERILLSPLFEKNVTFICTRGTQDGPGKSHNSFNSKFAADLVVRNNDSESLLSVFDGKVIVQSTCSQDSASSCGHGFGNFVKVLSNDGHLAFYSHLKTVSVQTGDSIKAGTIIGTIGDTGQAEVKHLHFSLHYDWREEGIKKYTQVPVLLPESIPFNLSICKKSSCEERETIQIEDFKCSTSKISEFNFYYSSK